MLVSLRHVRLNICLVFGCCGSHDWHAFQHFRIRATRRRPMLTSPNRGTPECQAPVVAAMTATQAIRDAGSTMRPEHDTDDESQLDDHMSCNNCSAAHECASNKVKGNDVSRGDSPFIGVCGPSIRDESARPRRARSPHSHACKVAWCASIHGRQCARQLPDPHRSIGRCLGSSQSMRRPITAVHVEQLRQHQIAAE